MKHFAVNGSLSGLAVDTGSSSGDLRDQLWGTATVADVPTASPVTRMSTTDKQRIAAVVVEILKQRRRRERCFGAELFADPAWDILLELYAAELSDRRVSVSQLTYGASVPATTGLRWIALLEKKGMISRRSDPLDGRRAFMSLSEEASAVLTGFFESVPAAAAVI